MGTTNGLDSMEGDVGGEGLRGYSSEVAAVVNYFGPTDLRKLHVDAGQEDVSFMVRELLGGKLESRIDLAMNASPVVWASASSAPMLIVHGTEDQIVPYSQSVRLHNALSHAGANSTLRPVEGGRHGRGADFDNDALIEEVADFFDQHLRD